jgi:LPXTG-motif cell wall-anchored protein
VNECRLVRRLGSPLLALPILMASLVFGGSPAGAADEASAADVAAGLKKIQGIVENTASAAGKDSTKAEQLMEGIEPEWEKIEGTLKSNDTDAYVALEDNFTLLKIGTRAGDAAKTTTASENVAAAVTAYLDKHPAPAEAPPEPAASGDTRSAAAASAAPGNPLPRTGPSSTSVLLSGMALALGGLATIGGARRR